ncbi:PilZ domain-containing protein [Sphingomonas aerophila]|jgi:hypothetical protein|uniref:PilZ domain-containing protein n=1 Tax=Sphingomonas aerophila TaxID=1344948 RepID=A0A7W9BCW6_9SPHN|nr:PilZ domain-containing protein [Sphingomonas aerophila]MBB5714873.1 hypothetical protein [Sphingomonas aerophila]
MTDPDATSPDELPLPEPTERAPRANVLLKAIIEQFGGAGISAHRVRDLSTRGMRIDQVDVLRQGATVLVTVGALEAVGATVVWVADGSAGLEFATEIDPDQARARVAIAPKTDGSRHQPASSGSLPPVKAGWVQDMQSPYRR